MAEFGTRMKGIAQEINDKLDVEGLCRGMNKRLRRLAEAEGGRLPH